MSEWDNILKQTIVENEIQNNFNPIKELYKLILSDDNSNFIITSNTTYDSENKKLNKFIISIQEDIKNKFSFVTIRESEEMFFYLNGEYIPYAETIIKEVIKCLLESVGITSISKYKYEQIIFNLKIDSYINREDFILEQRFIPLKNGIYDINNKILLDFNPKFYVTEKIPVTYDPNIKMNTIPSWLFELLSNDQKKYDTIQEFLGYCLYRGYPIQKFLLIYGSGRNGKGVFLEVLKNFIGQKNMSSVELKDFENRFMPAELYKKLINVAGDIGNAKINDVGIIKALTGGDLIKAEKKGKDPYFFVNYSKPIFSCNSLPNFADDSVGLLRRILLISFEKEYIEGKNAYNKEELIKLLTTDNEMTGLLNFALEGLHRLLKNNQFSNKSTVESIRDTYELEKNSVYVFLENHIKVLNYQNDFESSYIPSKVLYTYYVQFCKNNKIKLIKNHIAFGRIVKKWNKYVIIEPKWLNGITQQCYLNIELITEDLIQVV